MIGIKRKKPKFGEEMLRSLNYSMKYGDLKMSEFSDAKVSATFTDQQIECIRHLIVQLNQQICSGDEERIIDALYSIYHLAFCAPLTLSYFDDLGAVFNAFFVVLQNNSIAFPMKMSLSFFRHLLENAFDQYGEYIIENDVFFPTIISKIPQLDAIKILNIVCQLYEPAVEYFNENGLLNKLFFLFHKFLSLSSSESICIEILNFFDNNFDSFEFDMKEFLFQHLLKSRLQGWQNIAQREILLFANHLEKTIDFILDNGIIPRLLNLLSKPGHKIYIMSVFTLLQCFVDFETDSFSGIQYLMENNIAQFLGHNAFRYDEDEIITLIFDLINNLIYHDQDILTNGINVLFDYQLDTFFQKKKMFELKLYLFQSDNPIVLQYAQEHDPIPEIVDFLVCGNDSIIQTTLNIILDFLQQKPENWAFAEIQEMVQQDSFSDVIQDLTSSSNETIKDLADEIISLIEEDD